MNTTAAYPGRSVVDYATGCHYVPDALHIACSNKRGRTVICVYFIENAIDNYCKRVAYPRVILTFQSILFLFKVVYQF